jgi:hypothetical protein
MRRMNATDSVTDSAAARMMFSVCMASSHVGVGTWAVPLSVQQQ